MTVVYLALPALGREAVAAGNGPLLLGSWMHVIGLVVAVSDRAFKRDAGQSLVEFAILLPSALDGRAATAVVDKIRRGLEKPFVIGGVAPMLLAGVLLFLLPESTK